MWLCVWVWVWVCLCGCWVCRCGVCGLVCLCGWVGGCGVWCECVYVSVVCACARVYLCARVRVCICVCVLRWSKCEGLSVKGSFVWLRACVCVRVYVFVCVCVCVSVVGVCWIKKSAVYGQVCECSILEGTSGKIILANIPSGTKWSSDSAKFGCNEGACYFCVVICTVILAMSSALLFNVICTVILALSSSALLF